MERGLGDMNWVQEYIGLPYRVGGRSFAGIDCWGLVAMVYLNELEIRLPDWVADENIDWEGAAGVYKELDTPADYCLVRTPRSGGLPDHWGVYIAGGVLSASKPSSCFVQLDQYLMNNPDTKLGTFCFDSGVVQ